MKLKWKIYFLCLLIYIVSIIVTAAVVTSSSYNSLMNKEIQRNLNAQESIKKSSLLYLLTNMKDTDSSARLEDYSQALVDMFTSKNVYLQIYSPQGQLIADGFHLGTGKSQSEIVATSSRDYILKTIGRKHYLFINEKLEYGGHYVILTTVNDVSQINVQRTNMYISFLKASIMGLIIMSFLVVMLGQFITNPLGQLIATSRKISEGNYSHRVPVKSQDEIGMLSLQFNTMAEEIESKIRELQIEAQNKQEFIDNLTHELRTPLTSIIGYSDLLLAIKYDEKKFSKGLSFINSEGKRILTMVNELMNLILSRKDKFNITPYSVKTLLCSACESLSLKAKEKLIDLITEGDDFYLPVDETLFTMVLINLLDNAIKASPEESTIDVSYKLSDHIATITIKDQGCGIAKEHLNKITEPFYRVDKSRTREEGGAGLGLALVKTILEAHGASINFDSELEKGTSVTISMKLEDVN